MLTCCWKYCWSYWALADVLYASMKGLASTKMALQQHASHLILILYRNHRHDFGSHTGVKGGQGQESVLPDSYSKALTRLAKYNALSEA